MTADAISLKALCAGDEAALFALFAPIRAAELAMDAWEPALRDRVLRQQFDAQRRGHRAQHPGANEQLIIVDDRAAGWIAIDRSGPAWHLVDIAIAPEFRRRKIAFRILRSLQDEAAAAGRAIGLMVLRSNSSARTLYDGLGFRTIGGTETHWIMEWRA